MRSSVPVFSSSEQWSLLGRLDPSASSQPAGLVETNLKSQPNSNFCSRRLLAWLSFVGYGCSLLTFLSGQRERTGPFPWRSDSVQEILCIAFPPTLAFFFIFYSQNESPFLLTRVIFCLAPTILSSVLECLPRVYMALDTPHNWYLTLPPVMSRPREFKPVFLVKRVNQIVKCQNALRGQRQTLLSSCAIVESLCDWLHCTKEAGVW